MSKLIYEWLMSFDKGPAVMVLLVVALAAAWMTEIHLNISKTEAAVTAMSIEAKEVKLELWQELRQQRQMNIELLQNIDRRLSRIEGKLDK